MTRSLTCMPDGWSSSRLVILFKKSFSFLRPLLYFVTLWLESEYITFFLLIYLYRGLHFPPIHGGSIEVFHVYSSEVLRRTFSMQNTGPCLHVSINLLPSPSIILHHGALTFFFSLSFIFLSPVSFSFLSFVTEF